MSNSEPSSPALLPKTGEGSNSHKVRVLILTAFHGRAHISELYWLGIKRLRENFNIQTLAVVSDPENLALAKQHSDHVLETVNEPHGRKMNLAMSEVVNLEFELLMQLGSDNLISNIGMMKNIDLFTRGNLFFGFNKILFYNYETAEAKQKFYGNVFGAGRCITRPILIKALRKQQLWDDERARGMDMNFESSIDRSIGLGPLPVEFDVPQVIDVKSKENIWAYDYFKEPACSPEIMKDMVSKQEWKYLTELPKAPLPSLPPTGEGGVAPKKKK